MRTLVALVVVALTSSLAHAGPEDDRRRERIFRALTVVDELQLDDATIARVFPVLSAYEKDRDKLIGEYDAVTAQLATATDPTTADKLLDQSLATQRALIAVEAKLVVKLRQLLPAAQAARARVMLLAAVPPAPTPVRAYDPGALFPPGSSLTASPCDPFTQMHRCPL